MIETDCPGVSHHLGDYISLSSARGWGRRVSLAVPKEKRRSVVTVVHIEKGGVVRTHQSNGGVERSDGHCRANDDSCGHIAFVVGQPLVSETASSLEVLLISDRCAACLVCTDHSARSSSTNGSAWTELRECLTLSLCY